MSRFIVPIILIGLSVAGFFMFTNPTYSDPDTGLKALQDKAASYNEALNNSKALESERDKLTQKYNAIDPTNLAKLQKFLPDSVDNIRLILEIENIASPYGMELTDVKYSTTDQKVVPGQVGGAVQANAATATANKAYGAWDLEFSTSGSYTDFLNFLKDLEKNLRVVDVSSIDFTSDTGAGLNTSTAGTYKYGFKIKTYWLKN